MAGVGGWIPGRLAVTLGGGRTAAIIVAGGLGAGLVAGPLLAALGSPPPGWNDRTRIQLIDNGTG